ncbi:Lsr2 family DNA-binding protein [Streptomyces zaomyceticus]
MGGRAPGRLGPQARHPDHRRPHRAVRAPRERGHAARGGRPRHRSPGGTGESGAGAACREDRPRSAAAVAPTPIHTGISGACSRDELTAIQAWAREHGHQVADRGLPSKTVLDAYAAAHPATPARSGLNRDRDTPGPRRLPR